MTAKSTAIASAEMDMYLRTPELDGSSPEAKRLEIAEYFNVTFERYESLFETLKDDAAFFTKAIPLRHPLIFYFGHTATFFVNKLLLAGLLKQRINPRFESMFAVGVDEMSWDDLDEAHYDWPTVDEVKAYRAQVKQTVNEIIKTAPLSLPINWENPWWAILMGIEHEQIHLETSSVLIRQQNLDWIQTHPEWRPFPAGGTAPKNQLLTVTAGEVNLGKAYDDSYYGWDNEYGEHHAELAEFSASKFLVSNAEFLEFVEAGGYKTPEFWEQEGLQWLQYTQAECPSFWLNSAEGWQLRLMTEVVAMPWNWPVDVNYHEAKAFCNWKAAQTGEAIRLPTEDEWYRLYDFAGVEELAASPAPANLHLDHAASSCPVDAFAHGDFYDVVGNVWQWTETAIYPFDGFKVHPIYDDFTTPTYDGRHALIKGGSWISSGNETRKASRYAFRKHFFQHAGFRYVKSTNPVEINSSGQYETDPELSRFAEFHYGDSQYGVANFPKAIAELAVAAMGDRPKQRALDMGCAVGRTSFELARHFDAVTGIDFSARSINLGVQMAQQGVVRYTVPDEGELVFYRERRLAEFGLDEYKDKVEFLQGDACNLKSLFSGYDLIVAPNLLERLYKPRLFLESVHKRINAGGLLVLSSSYDWSTEICEVADWLGGFKKDGESFTSLDGIKAILEQHFDLVAEPQSMPYVVAESSRKFQHNLAEVTIWERRA